MTLHLIKLCVGVAAPRELAAWQKRRRAQRRASGGPNAIFHLTRNAPRRGEEILDGGSMYWVIKGLVTVRQRIIGFEQTTRDGEPACAIKLHAKLVVVAPQPMRAFQGWRYLEAEDAPPDLDKAGKDLARMPPKMLAELRALGLV